MSFYLYHVASLSEPKVAAPFITTSCGGKEEEVENSFYMQI